MPQKFVVFEFFQVIQRAREGQNPNLDPQRGLLRAKNATTQVMSWVWGGVVSAP